MAKIELEIQCRNTAAGSSNKRRHPTKPLSVLSIFWRFIDACVLSLFRRCREGWYHRDLTMHFVVKDGVDVSSPGKTILYGEHAVVHGVPAIAASVALHTYVSVLAGDPTRQVELDFPDVKLAVSWSSEDIGDISPVQDIPNKLDPELHSRAKRLASMAVPDSQPFGRVAAEAFIYLYMSICPPGLPSLKYKATSTLPIGAGLGSSASFSASLAAALLKAANRLSDTTPHEEAMELVTRFSFLGECCIHGKPSGIDNVVATRGGAVYFQRRSGDQLPYVKPYPQFPELQLVLTDTTVPRLTSELVARVSNIKERWPRVFEPLLASFTEIVHEADKLLSQFPADPEFVKKIGELAEFNHGLLATLSVSHPSLEKVRDVSKQLGIGTTKLTGAGGGGCAITIASSPNSLHEGIDRFREMLGPQFRVFATTLGVKGIGYAEYKECDLSQLDWKFW